MMLLRSPGDGESCNIDIIFTAVCYIEIPQKMNGIEIVETTQEDVEYITRRIGDTSKTITVLWCENRKYYVVSSRVDVQENDLVFYELPFDIPDI